MKQKIFKYELSIKDSQIIKMPIGSKILSVQVQYEVPCIWALVEPSKDTTNITIEMFGTGHIIDNEESADRKFMGTIQLGGGNLVFHVFEKIYF